MKNKPVRIAIGVIEGFIALSAIGGGIALLIGTYENDVLVEPGGLARFPLEWLAGTPFSDYSVPALLLAVVVGGSSLLGAVTIFTSRKVGTLASVGAGLIMAGYIVGEVVMLRRGVSWIEGLYFGLGLLTSALAVYLWTVEESDHRLRSELIWAGIGGGMGA